MRERSDRPGSRSIRKAFGAFVSITVLSSIFLTSIPASGQEAPLEQPTIASDKADYAPGETVTLTGTGWTGDGNVRIEVDDDQGRNWYYTESVVVQPDGTITDTFTLPSHFIAVYYVTATGLDTARQATTSFTDMSIGLYDQCSNDDGDGYAAGDTGCRWTNGNLQSNNSTYSEGEATVQRLWLTDFEPGSTHTVTLKYGTTKSGKHAYDFLTTWDWSENWITEADRCQDITGCVGLGEDLLDIPLDPNVPDAYENFTRQFVMRGGDMTVATTPSIVSGTYAGDSETVITITFTVAGSGSMCVTKNDVTTCGVALWFGAHIARQADWGTGNGAGNIPGSPYHVALDAVDGAAVGQRDNQMQSATVVVNGTIIIAKDAIPNAAQDFSFNLTNGSTVNQNFSLDDDSDATLPSSQTFAVPPGTYTASELNIPSGWSLTDIVCVDPSTNSTWDIPAGTATIVLASAETVTCTFTDTKGAQLSIHKSTVGGNGTFDYEATGTGMPEDAAGPDFQITTSGGSGSYSGNPIAFAAGSFGTKTVTETVPTGWTLTNITCTGDTTGVLIGSDADFDAGDTSVEVPIDAGDSVSCTFTNTKDATLTVIKDAIPDDAQDFSFTNTGFAPATDLLDDDGDETNTLKSSVTYTFSGSDFDAGAETVTEDGETGWALTDLDCTGDD
ncbi:MAG TPA: hypothetical protein VFT80_02845, partial [Actinomycetota bacterium]|nr:hypothetical protein [Actinomycetota bacterium]